MPGSYSTDNMEKIVPRGIRNNNPLNIRVGNHWLGEVEHPSDNEFEQFVCIHYGLRAAFVLLRRYIERYGLNTIPDIISRWAPSSENNTSAYIEKVVRLSKMLEISLMRLRKVIKVQKKVYLKLKMH